MPSHSTRRLRLAAAAVLGLSGVGVLPLAATAAPASSGFAPAQTAILSPAATRYTTGDDGTDTTVRLEAGGGSTVSRVRFEYQVKDVVFGQGSFGQWMPIATVNRNDDGLFATEWTGAGNPSLGTRTVNLRAVPLDASGAVLPDADPVLSRDHVESQDVRGVNLANGSALGYFQQAYTGMTDTLVSVAGTTGPTGGTSTNPMHRTLRVGYYTSGSNRSTAKVTRTAVPAGDFAHAVSLDEYDVDPAPGATNQVAMWAELVDPADPPVVQADETESFTLYRQAITTVSATADRSNVAPGEQARVTVTVVDQSGEPVVGAEVRQGDGTGAGTNNRGARYTDADGRTVFLQDPGATSYYANTNDGDAFSSADGDKRSGTVTVEAYQPVTTSIVARSADGAAFDLDEADNAPSTGVGGDGDATDVTVQVRDQRGNDVTPGSTQALQYHWVVSPFGGGPSTRYPATGSSTGASEGGGRYSVVVPHGGNGTYELVAGLTGDTVSSSGTIAPTRVLTVRAGQAVITWDRRNPQELPAGTTSTVSGRLGLADGTLLPGRALGLTLQRDGTTTNEDPTPDAGFVADGGPALTTEVTTSAAGTFSVAVTDPAESPQLPELGDDIDARSVANAFGNAGAARDNQVVNFVVDDDPTEVVLTESREASTLRPGEFTLYTVKVANRLGGGVPGQQVALSTTAGYFSLDDGNASTTSPTAAPAPATGQDVGTFRNDGGTVTLRTGDDGTATVFLAMGREAGFDDDGQVVSRVTATAGALADDDQHTWDSSNPLNGGTVKVVESQRAQTSAILPRAQLADTVHLDVEVTDQFGNRVGGEQVRLTDSSPTGTVSESDGTADDGTIVSDFTPEGDVALTSTTDADQALTASWTTERTTYTGIGTTTTSGTETLTGSYTVDWYAVDYAASDLRLTADGAGPRRVGDQVTLTYRALDQLGQPISDLHVGFTRSGPGAAADTSGASDALTGPDGTATYTFVGSLEGRATVRATGRQGGPSGDVVDAATRTATVDFEAEEVEKARPELTVRTTVRGRKVVVRVAVDAATQDPVTGEVKVREDGRLIGLKELTDGTRKFVFRNVERGFHTYRVTFLGNDLVRKASRTVGFSVTR